MTEAPNYGQLLDTAAQQIAGAAARPPPIQADEALRDALGLIGLAALAGRHARFLGRAGADDNPALRLAARLDQAVLAAADLLPIGEGQPDSAWREATRTLGLAHDLLALHVGPAGEPRSPDAATLARPEVITAAAHRLGALVAVVIGTAVRRAAYLRGYLLLAADPTTPAARPDSAGPPVALRIAQALDRLAPARATAAQLGARHDDSHHHLAALNEISPLHDSTGTAFEQTLERLRLTAHTLAQPPTRPARAALYAMADLAVAIGAAAGENAAVLAHHSTSHAAYGRVADSAHAAMAAWKEVRHLLGTRRLLGFEGLRTVELVDQARRQIADLTTPADADQYTALLAARRAALVLPDLAAASHAAVHRLQAAGLLLTATPGHRFGPPTDRDSELLDAYGDAVRLSRRLLKTCAGLPGPQPLPARTAHLTDPTIDLVAPVVDQHPTLRALDPARRSRDVRLLDPHHGVLACDTDLFERALRHPDRDLWNMLSPHANRLHLTGTESRATLAALASLHTPTLLGSPAAEHRPPPPPASGSAQAHLLDATPPGRYPSPPADLGPEPGL
ncbi:hypothetical protein I6A60_19090 [Frankia sp. AgB1.9]|uniref:hypothetical protein n=1 Tax=unclassified Frankia TaxID=2632575 RepID=UPI001933A33C|nr:MULTISPECIES: hypothetical protein [unclassified Frankia]MBL7487901.1 hypothetical protein [Frankia sp. AgW1.1]MBL7549966.1 hypothetical protein [Frankia sp. AgB1.9]MBL7621455.1 hypothetical protein [Frankia sp. AgB1.8]